jgi:xanthine/uracil permease
VFLVLIAEIAGVVLAAFMKKDVSNVKSAQILSIILLLKTSFSEFKLR